MAGRVIDEREGRHVEVCGGVRFAEVSGIGFWTPKGCPCFLFRSPIILARMDRRKLYGDSRAAPQSLEGPIAAKSTQGRYATVICGDGTKASCPQASLFVAGGVSQSSCLIADECVQFHHGGKAEFGGQATAAPATAPKLALVSHRTRLSHRRQTIRS